MWLVNTDKTAKEVRDELKVLLDNNDELLVFNAGTLWAGAGFDQKAYDWLNKNWIKG